MYYDLLFLGKLLAEAWL